MKTMSKLAGAAAVLALLVVPAASQTKIKIDKPRVNVGDVNSNSTSQAEQNVTGVNADVQTYFEASDIPSDTRNTSKVKNVPDAIAPSIVGGNPCMISASVGGSGIGFGFGVGIGVEDEGCETRQVTALISNMGDRQAALMHLCMNDSRVENTVKAMGFATCQAYAGVITPGSARVALAAAAQPVSMQGATNPTVIITPAQRPVSTSMTLAGECDDREYKALRSGGEAWDQWSPACRARHVTN